MAANAYVGPYLGQAKEVAWEYLRRFAEPIITLKNEGELWIETIQGHRIRIHGADNPDRIRGAYLEALGLSRGAGSSGTSMSSRPRRLITFGMTACL